MKICYHTYDGRDYLYRISYCTREETEAKVNNLNANKPLRDGLTDMTNVDYFYIMD